MTTNIADLAAYLPLDRRRALIAGSSLPNRTNGAVLFADISGYTPLTQAMVAAFGPKRGVDHLTDQINSIFSVLIAEVHRFGGSVINFGGDALTCWFDTDNGQQATLSALAMQQMMVQFAEIVISTDLSVSLHMKVAVVTGQARRFVVGDPQIQQLDVLAGSLLKRMATAERLAQAKEVIIDEAIFNHMWEKLTLIDWRKDKASSRRFAVVGEIIQPPSRLPDTTPQKPYHFSIDQLRSWVLPPVYDRITNGQPQFLADVRPVTVIFLKFNGLNYDQDIKASEKLSAYIRWVQQVLVPLEGFLLKLTIGDKGSYLFITFGAPIAHDDDISRAVQAAINLRELPRKFEYIQNVQMGLSQGQMLAGAFGSPARYSYDLLGNEANMAARLMVEAKPGQILVTQQIVTAVGENFQFSDLGLVHIKGSLNPVSAFAAIARLTQPSTTFEYPLVGRRKELAWLMQRLDQTLIGKSQTVSLEGVAGIGKSHLTTKFIIQAQTPHLRILKGACESINQGLGYAAWRSVFRTLFAVDEHSPSNLVSQIETQLANYDLDWRVRSPLLGDLLDLNIPDNATTTALNPQQRQDARITLAIDIIKAEAMRQPLLIIIEDIHWMDEGSSELTIAIARGLINSPMMLLLIHRPLSALKSFLADLNDTTRYHHLPLNELPETNVGDLIEQRIQGSISDIACALIQARAQGNPFYIEELVDALRESGGLMLQQPMQVWTLSDSIFDALRVAHCLTRDTETGSWILLPDAPLFNADIGLPDTVQGIVLSRIDRLPETRRLTLKVAAVIGQIFDLNLLAHAHPMLPSMEQLQQHIQSLTGRDLVRLDVGQEQTRYTFKHNITQEVAYETLLQDQQRQLHKSIGEALEQSKPDMVEQLAYHFVRGSVQDKSLIYLGKAAQKAQRESANETALNYFNQALALEDHWVWRKGQVEVLHILGRRSEEATALQAFETVADAPAFEVAYRWGLYFHLIGNYAKAKKKVTQAKSISQAMQNVSQTILCLIQLGVIDSRQGNFAESKINYETALKLLAGQTSAPINQIKIQMGLGHISRQEGDYEAAKTYYEQALQRSRQHRNRQTEAMVLASLGTMMFHRRQLATALDYHKESLILRRLIGDRAGEGASLLNIAQTLRDQGDYDLAESKFLEALAIQQAIGNRWDEANTWNDLGILYQTLGRYPEAQSCLERGLDISKEIGDQSGEAYLLYNLGSVLHNIEQSDKAINLLTRGLKLATSQSDQYLVGYFHSLLGLIYLETHEIEAAIFQAQTALRIRRKMDLIIFQADDLTTIASASMITDDSQSALNFAQQAITILNDCGGEGPEFPQRDYYVCYQVYSTAGLRQQAKSALKAAHALVQRRANKINNADLRLSFLENVPINHVILETYSSDNQP